MVRDSRKIRQNLLKKGFKEEQGAKHILYVLVYNGKERNARTFMNRNNQDIDDNLILSMSKELHLEKQDFLDLIDCPMPEKEYIKILKDKNLLKE